MDRRQFLIQTGLAAGLGAIVSACKTAHGDYEVHGDEGHGPPAHAPAHGYRRKYGRGKYRDRKHRHRKHRRKHRDSNRIDGDLD